MLLPIIGEQRRLSIADLYKVCGVRQDGVKEEKGLQQK
jgi:hypothetical protein